MAKSVYYKHGAMLVHPHRDEHGVETAVRVMFRGSFGRRRLRKMIRDTTALSKKTEIDWAIDNLVTRLVPANFKKLAAALYEGGKDE